MKLPLRSTFLAAATLVAASTASAFTVDFTGGAGDIALFNQYNSAATPTISNVFAYDATAGVNGADGALHSPTTDATAVYQSESFDLTSTTTTYSFSAMVKTGGTLLAGSAWVVGLSDDNNQGFYVTDSTFNSLAIRLNTGPAATFTIQNIVGGAATQFNTTAVTIAANNWYRLKLDVANNGAGAFTTTATVEDWGVQGTAFVGTLGTTGAQTITNSSLIGDATTYAAIRGAGSPNAAFDNFTSVPEPSTYGLMGAGALAAVAFVRRRKAAALAA